MTDERDNVTPQPLVSRDRIRGCKRIIAEGTAPADVTEEQIKAVIDDAEIFRRKYGIERRAIATALGYAPSVISDFLAAQYNGNNGQVAIDLESWLVEEETRRARPQTTTFCWSNCALTIKAAAMYCLDYRRIGLVYGPDSTGIGKTTALQAIHQLLGPRRSSLVTIDKLDASPTGMIHKLSGALRLTNTGSNRVRFGRIVEKLKGRSHILLIDQVHNLRGAAGDKPLYILADLFDSTATAQLWCGTADMVAYLNRQRVRASDESLAQIRRRVFPAIDLMESMRGNDGGGGLLVTLDQVREAFARNRLRLTGDATRFLCRLINTPDSGGFGIAVQVVDFATVLAELSGAKEVSLALVREAMAKCLGSSRTELLVAEMQKEPTPAAIARAG